MTLYAASQLGQINAKGSDLLGTQCADMCSSKGDWCAFARSTADAKGARRRLDFNFALVLRGEPERAAGSLNCNAAAAFVWIIHKLVEADVRPWSDRQIAVIIKLQFERVPCLPQ